MVDETLLATEPQKAKKIPGPKELAAGCFLLTVITVAFGYVRKNWVYQPIRVSPVLKLQDGIVFSPSVWLWVRV